MKLEALQGRPFIEIDHPDWVIVLLWQAQDLQWAGRPYHYTDDITIE